ncbi:MAG: beta-galactosidase, partial [Candidatus Bathyarchaeia archaeon]
MKRIFLGTDYYPEQWPRDFWSRDVKLMSDAKFNVVRLAEFAWAQLEPKPEEFNFDWLDEIISELGAKGIYTVLGTPTGTAPPIWFPKMYPDAFPVDDTGHRLRFGRDGAWMFYCPHNPNFMRCVERIVRKMAEHYKDNSYVYGWQIDNEIQWPDPPFHMVCYCDYTKEEFRKWLREKYGSIENLNKKCGTFSFPIQIYEDWGQIDPPWPPLFQMNRGLALDWLRFRSDSLIKFVEFQANIIRSVAPHQKITTNLVAPHLWHIDQYKLSKILDFVSYDSYPKHKKDPDPATISWIYDWYRTMKNEGFWIMEMQSGMSAILGMMPRPNEIRKWTYQAIAHGATGVLYFCWRTKPWGVEQFWHGILGHDNRLNRRYFEVCKVGEELDKLGQIILGTKYEAEAAILFSYNNVWSVEIEKDAYGRRYIDDVLSIYKGFWLNYVQTDTIEPTRDLTKYKVVFVPFHYIITEEEASSFKRFVENGGILIADARLAVKDKYNEAFLGQPLPALLTDLFGVMVCDYDLITEEGKRFIKFKEDSPILPGKCFSPTVWVESLEVIDAEVLATHVGTWMGGQPAVTMKKYGKGIAIYFGSF